jgi:P-type E1-E2 ATPase
MEFWSNPAVVMEQLGAVTQVAFDKTGTLTEGRPHLTGLRTLPGAELDEEELLVVAAAAEQNSQHPLGGAIVRAAQEAGLSLPAVADFGSMPGRGVRARVTGRHVEVGSPEYLLVDHSACDVVAELESDGHSVVAVLVDGVPAGLLRLSDRVRSDAAGAVIRLSTLTGTAPVLLTGDNPVTARRLAEQVGISDVRAGLLPDDKVSAVRDLQQAGARVALIGDGVNDAPALATAHTGIAMGGTGSDLALDTADAVITRDELAAVPTVIALARRARRLVVANLIIAATFIGALVAWDLFGDLPLPLGVAGHEGSTVIVGLNGLRLLRDAAWRRAAMNT